MTERAAGIAVRALLATVVTVVCGCHASLHSRFPPPPEPLDESTRLAERAAEEAAIESFGPRARAIVEETVRRLGERFGRPDPNPRAITVRIVRGTEPTACGTGGSACTSGWGDDVTIELRADSVLSGAMDLELTAAHEAVHAYFRRQLSSWEYRRIPEWLQEGMGIWLAGQAHAKLLELLADNSEAPWEELAGLEAEESYDRYFEYALALEFLDEAPGGVDAILHRILDGERAYDAIEFVTGHSRGGFLREARQDAKERLEAIVAVLPAGYREAVRLQREKKFVPELELLVRVLLDAGIDVSRGVPAAALGEAPEPRVLLPLEMWVGTAAAHQPPPLDNVIDTFHALLSLPASRRCEGAAALRYSLALAYIRERREAEALAEYARIFRLHHESPGFQSSSTASITRGLFYLHRDDEALRWIEASAGVLPDDELAYMRGVTLIRLGRAADGVPLLERLASRDGRWAEDARRALDGIEQGPAGAALPGS